jgi:hypothetical protein
MSLLLALTVVTEIVDVTRGHGSTQQPKRKKPPRHRYEVDQFQYVTAQPQKLDDDECLLLLLM